MFLRLTPIFPNISVNLISPIVGVSYKIFVLGTLIGLIPFNVIHVSTGVTIQSVTAMGLQQSHLLMLFCLGFLSLVPVFALKLGDWKKSKVPIN